MHHTDHEMTQDLEDHREAILWRHSEHPHASADDLARDLFPDMDKLRALDLVETALGGL